MVLQNFRLPADVSLWLKAEKKRTGVPMERLVLSALLSMYPIRKRLSDNLSPETLDRRKPGLAGELRGQFGKAADVSGKRDTVTANQKVPRAVTAGREPVL